MPKPPPTLPLADVVRTLLANGYRLEAFDRASPQSVLFQAMRGDVFGAEARSVILLSATGSAAMLTRLKKKAEWEHANPVFLSTEPIKPAGGVRHFNVADFFALLGGQVRTDKIFRADLSTMMHELGHNRLPQGFVGKPDDLLEEYSADILRFLMDCPVRRYGQERRFEKLPDGLALGRHGLNVYFDAKAYGEEFHPTADDIRRFVAYVSEFNQRYRDVVGPLSRFLVISGSFSTDKQAIQEKADDFAAQCDAKLVFVAAKKLGEITSLFREFPAARTRVQWRRLLTSLILDPSAVKVEIQRVLKDRILN